MKTNCTAINRKSLQQILLFSLLVLLIKPVSAQTTAEQAGAKIKALNKLILTAEKMGIDTQKERMTIRTSEMFLKYADWDQSHTNENKAYFEKVAIYKNDAQQLALDLADYERNEVNVMLQKAISTLTQLIDGEQTRKPSPLIDWSQVTMGGNQLTYEGRPVFLTDYTWKPKTHELTQYHGNQDGFYLDPKQVINAEGDINPSIINHLRAKSDGSMGFIFLGNKSVPQWAERKYGPGFKMREDTYTGYDIDNPGAREMMQFLFKGTIPIIKGKKFTQLGYMLCNEPHFYTTKDVWATGPVSNYTMKKFKNWLSQKHTSISELNALWHTHFPNFQEVTLTIPIDKSLQGTPQWYDWVSFNNLRVTQWYAFLKQEIRKYDPQAKVHLKVMPNLWSGNQRNHGLDMEALTRMSDIIGNDAGAENSYMWGGPKEWEKHYSWDWRELCMSYDFFKSVSPNKIIYNTELHFLSKGNFRDLRLKPSYARATFWLAHMQGLNASQIWFWAREADGSIKSKAGKGYAGSNNQQPRIVNEVHATMIDLNAFSEEITAIQREAKPIRIFYSETSAINDKSYMDHIFNLYESLFFEGIPVGFVTKEILKQQDHNQWDFVLIHHTQSITTSEREELQHYLNRGGIIISDQKSATTNEYGQPLQALTQGDGELIRADSIAQMKAIAMSLLKKKGKLPDVSVLENNTGGHKGCVWRCIKNKQGNHLLSIVNLGKTEASLTIELKEAQQGTLCRDLLKGIPASSHPTLKPNEVYFVEVVDQ